MNSRFLSVLLLLFIKTTSVTANGDADLFYRTFVMPGVSPQTKDAYICTTMAVNATEEWITRYEPLASANRAHHMLLYGCSDVNPANREGYWDCGHHGICSGSSIMYAWAKNAPSTNLPDNVGFRIGQNFNIQYLVLQIHYANPLPNEIKDHSGLKMLMTNNRQKYKAGIYLLLKNSLVIPPYTEKFHGDMNCVVNLSDDIYLFAFRVHAHVLGTVITGYRFDQKTKELDQIAKGNPQWPQSFYPTEKIYKIKTSDVLHARCTFNSTKRGRNTFIGPTSDDEMCNLYLMYYTDREKGPDSNYCAVEQFPSLSKNLPPDSDQPLPKNDKLSEQTVGENKNMNKEISYDKLFEANTVNVDDGEGPNTLRPDSRFPVKPVPVRINADPVTFSSVDTIQEKNHKGLGKIIGQETKRNKTSRTQFHLEKNWGPKKYKLGQVSAVAVNSEGDVVIFHRGDRVWDSTSFDGWFLRNTSNPISQHTLLHLQRVSGEIMHKWGEKFFYMPHGLSIDVKDNVWVTDVGLHQVFKFPPGYRNTKPQIIVGKRFEPGSGKNSFCRPTGVAVLKNGEFFVSDGYCNNRIVHFTSDGKFLKEIDASKGSGIEYSFGRLSIPHSLTLAEDEKEVCVADREYGRVLCFYVNSFHLSRQFQFAEWGQRLFAVVYSKADDSLYAVNGPQFLSKPSKVMIFQVNFSSNSIGASFSPNDEGFSNPHDIAVSLNGNDLYVVEIGPNKIWKYSKGNARFTLYSERKSLSITSYIIIALMTIPIFVFSVIGIFLRYRNGSSHNHGFGLKFRGDRNFGPNLLPKKHGFERVPTDDTIQDSDSTDSEEHFSLVRAKR